MALTPGQTTLAAVRNLAQSYADLQDTAYVPPSDWLAYINGSYSELYDLLVTAYGNDYYVALPFTFVTDGSSDAYLISTYVQDFYKLLGVDLQISTTPGAGQFITLKTFAFAERNRSSVPTSTLAITARNLRYRLRGNYLAFNRIPQGGLTIRVWYVPRLVPLAQDTDIIDGISGWEEFIAIDSAIKAKDKEESDTSVLILRKKEMKERIEQTAANRDAGMPATVADTSSDYWGDGLVGGSGWWE